MSESIIVDGAELHYFSSRSGSPAGPWCLWPTSLGLEPYERLTPPEVAEALSIVYVELRASGNSGGEARELTFDRVAADLDAVREHLGLGRVVVLGHSILGALAIEYACRFPQSVTHVIGVGTPTVGDMAKSTASANEFFEADASKERKAVLAGNLARLPEAPSLGQLLLAQAPRQFYDPHFDPAPCFEGARGRPEFFARLLGPLTSGWEAASAVDGLEVPMLVACGRHDYSVPYTAWDGVAVDRPLLTVSVFPRSGHYPFFEEGGRFASVVADWIRSTGSG